MPLKTIHVVRHAFRSAWTTDPSTGRTTSGVPSPTRIPADPALTAYGEEQAEALAHALAEKRSRITRVYSSPWYRCVQTVAPFVRALQGEQRGTDEGIGVLVDAGLGEFFGAAPYPVPQPASPSLLRALFPSLFLSFVPSCIPNPRGESIPQLHDRVAFTLARIIADCDKEQGVESIVICTHAATVIAAGRALTGRMPVSVEEEDFGAFTAGLSTFIRRKGGYGQGQAEVEGDDEVEGWKGGRGVGGGWNCVENCNCDHLKNGPERGWHFFGDEAFVETDGEGGPESGFRMGTIDYVRGDAMGEGGGQGMLDVGKEREKPKI